MYFKIILIFSGALCIDAQRIHELCHTYGCFESSDVQLSVTLDGDEVYHADFQKGLLVWDVRVSIFSIAWAYRYALFYRSQCKINLQRWQPDKSVTAKPKEAPEILIYPRDEVIKEEENTLICFINHFYPPNISIRWTKNDVEISVEDPFFKTLPNSDGTFHVFSNLKFIPKEGDIYSCTVEHESLETPQTRFWEFDADEMNIGPALVCGLGLSLGVFGFAAGVFFFAKGNQCQSNTEVLT